MTPVYISEQLLLSSVLRQRNDCPVTSVLASKSSSGGVSRDTQPSCSPVMAMLLCFQLLAVLVTAE